MNRILYRHLCNILAGIQIQRLMWSCSPGWNHFFPGGWANFHFISPVDRMGGWLCFVISIVWIGVLTAVIGDVASAFGCSVGLKDSVTAIAFVALGTSVPGRICRHPTARIFLLPILFFFDDYRLIRPSLFSFKSIFFFHFLFIYFFFLFHLYYHTTVFDYFLPFFWCVSLFLQWISQRRLTRKLLILSVWRKRSFKQISRECVRACFIIRKACRCQFHMIKDDLVWLSMLHGACCTIRSCLLTTITIIIVISLPTNRGSIWKLMDSASTLNSVHRSMTVYRSVRNPIPEI